MPKNQPSYEERIEELHVSLNRRINLVKLTEVCMDMKVKEFNDLEDAVEIANDTSNDEVITDIVNQLHKL